MTQTTNGTAADVADAPTVDEAVAALAEGVPTRRIGGRRRPAAPAPEAPAPVAAPADEPAVAVEDLGPYVARLMAEARAAAAEYRRDAEREAAERAAEVVASAVADAEELRAAAARDAEDVVAAARVQAQALAARVTDMAAELRAGAEVLSRPVAQPGETEAEPAS